MTKINPQVLLDSLAEHDFFDFLGVPDSTLEPLIQKIDKDSRFSHFIATNECEAVSIAAGQYLASGNPSVVYLQNSGFGKTVHPITSLLTEEVCCLPVLLVIGHRGHPRVKDEPQHKCLGRILPNILKSIEVPSISLENNEEQIKGAVREAFIHIKEKKTAFALIVPPDILDSGTKEKKDNPHGLLRSKAIQKILESLHPETFYISTTGKISRELYTLREERGESHDFNFYTVGGMGCASSIALGISRKNKKANICVLDGDGAALMQLGSMASIGACAPSNYIHVILDNESYESTGGQDSLSPLIDFKAIALACAYKSAQLVDLEKNLVDALEKIKKHSGPHLLLVKVSKFSDPKLKRPDKTPRENANNFKNTLIRIQTVKEQ